MFRQYGDIMMLQEMIYDFLDVMLPDYYHLHMYEKILTDGTYATIYDVTYYSRENNQTKQNLYILTTKELEEYSNKHEIGALVVRIYDKVA